jgi:two-component system, OmpR family, response regulator
MLVEDELALADGLARVLEGESWSVDVISLGEPARLLQSEPFDVLLLDIGLPDLSGFEILRRLRVRGNEMPVLLLTARDGISDRVQGLDLGADNYVVKPFAVPELVARVRARLRRTHTPGGEADVRPDHDGHRGPARVGRGGTARAFCA